VLEVDKGIHLLRSSITSRSMSEDLFGLPILSLFLVA